MKDKKIITNERLEEINSEILELKEKALIYTKNKDLANLLKIGRRMKKLKKELESATND